MSAESGSGNRVRRVAEGVRVEIASLLGREVKDPGVAGAVVTRVEMPGDLRVAHVFVRLLDGAEDTDKRRTLLNSLRRASGMLRREVAQRLRLRYAPELRFTYDDGTDHTTRVEEILSEIEAEKRRKGDTRED
jgi:ribosome-binding factor A